MFFNKLNKAVVQSITDKIEVVRVHEVTTKQLVGEIVPEVLKLTWGNVNVTELNSLISALSPANRKVALVFFNTLQSHKYGASKGDGRVKAFGKRLADKTKVNDIMILAEKFFLADPVTGVANHEQGYFEGDFWAWVESEVDIEKKAPDYKKMFESALSNWLANGGDVKEITETFEAQLHDVEEVLEDLAPAA